MRDRLRTGEINADSIRDALNLRMYESIRNKAAEEKEKKRVCSCCKKDKLI